MTSCGSIWGSLRPAPALPAEVTRPQGSGRLIYFASASALTGPGQQAAYTAARAGVPGLMVSSARTLEPHGITVNCVLPGAATRMTNLICRTWRSLTRDQASRRSGLHTQAAGTSREPAHVAPHVIQLLSDQASGLTAQAYAAAGYQSRR